MIKKFGFELKFIGNIDPGSILTLSSYGKIKIVTDKNKTFIFPFVWEGKDSIPKIVEDCKNYEIYIQNKEQIDNLMYVEISKVCVKNIKKIIEKYKFEGVKILTSKRRNKNV